MTGRSAVLYCLWRNLANTEKKRKKKTSIADNEFHEGTQRYGH